MLENNEHPTIWISNNISRMDKAYLRRFTYAIKFEKPKQSVRVQMWQKCLSTNKLPADEQTAKSFAEKYSLCWLPADFKKREGCKRSIELSRNYDLYRQDYCGCEFSRRLKHGDD